MDTHMKFKRKSFKLMGSKVTEILSIKTYSTDLGAIIKSFYNFLLAAGFAKESIDEYIDLE